MAWFTQILSKNCKKSIFSFTKIFNEFGTDFYNISAALSLNVTINPGSFGLSTDSQIIIPNDNNKGIKVILHNNYLLRMKGAYAMQTIIFDSPLVSVRAKREVENEVANYFVGIIYMIKMDKYGRFKIPNYIWKKII